LQKRGKNKISVPFFKINAVQFIQTRITLASTGKPPGGDFVCGYFFGFLPEKMIFVDTWACVFASRANIINRFFDKARHDYI
jgi:hypothetical protein